ncbi:transposase [Williamwhitmania taraxaci]|uniref:REP element-mobilizing transposase RayT n=1 Tax=Williamwhitmania taraxaci TaxID=1640674 RepID=A0A1G6QEV0_9BACT|nr:transposase [Williamwhitmania taraxaci]SDC90701.1 REP element-mobilizing transposase RayT [Williamwhitmania taraxaci]
MTDLFRNRYRIPSAQAAWWDYANNGAYFITICTHDRVHLFGRITNGIMNLSDIGMVAHQCWMDIPAHFPFVELGAFVVMPNHVHGIIIIDNQDNQIETQNFASPQNPSPQNPSPQNQKSQNKFGSQSKNLASIIRGYKTGVTKYATMNNIPFKWQSLYHDHIIRNDGEYLRISEYIVNNPAKWEQDMFNKKDGKGLF